MSLSQTLSCDDARGSSKEKNGGTHARQQEKKLQTVNPNQSNKCCLNNCDERQTERKEETELKQESVKQHII